MLTLRSRKSSVGLEAPDRPKTDALPLTLRRYNTGGQRLGKANRLGRPWKENSTKIRVLFFRQTLGRNERSDDLARSSRRNYGSIWRVSIRCRNIHRRDVWLIPVVAPGVHSNDRSGLSDLAHLAIYRNLDQLVYDRSLHICLSAGPVWNYYRDEELKVAIRLRRRRARNVLPHGLRRHQERCCLERGCLHRCHRTATTLSQRPRVRRSR